MKKGWFLNPALVGGLDNNASLARDEIFGPVSVVLTYRTVEEAIKIANDSALGLKAYLFGAKDQCLKLVPELYVGTVQINGGSPLRPDAPMMGYKHSGVGAEWGEDGLREFMHPQHIDCPAELGPGMAQSLLPRWMRSRRRRLSGLFAVLRARARAPRARQLHPARHARRADADRLQRLDRAQCASHGARRHGLRQARGRGARQAARSRSGRSACAARHRSRRDRGHRAHAPSLRSCRQHRAVRARRAFTSRTRKSDLQRAAACASRRCGIRSTSRTWSRSCATRTPSASAFHDGDAAPWPGISLHAVPGHTLGMQAVRVMTPRGPVVLASDSSHFYANLLRRAPFVVTVDARATLRSYDKLMELAGSIEHIVPGHDPRVRELYPNHDFGGVELTRAPRRAQASRHCRADAF